MFKFVKFNNKYIIKEPHQMGSCSRYNTLSKYMEKNKDYLIEIFSKSLLNKKVNKFTGTYVDYWVEGEIELEDGSCYPVHHRWASEEESYLSKEIIEHDELTMEEYFNDFIVGNLIKKIYIGYDRDDMIYIYAIVESLNKNTNCIEENDIEIPYKYIDDISEIEIYSKDELLKWYSIEEIEAIEKEYLDKE